MALLPAFPLSSPARAFSFKISLAEWSLRSWLNSGKISNLEFPATTKEVFGIEAVEYVSSFFKGKEKDKAYLKELKQRTDDLGVQNVLIMVDMWGPHGALASPDMEQRKIAAENHYPWVDAAKFLGCHAIRVNAAGYGEASFSDAKDYFVEGLGQLADYGEKSGINILVENHGGYSSNGRWLSQVMREVNNDFCGTLPDFGNFVTDGEKGIFYDRLVGLAELMPYAKGVSAKSNDFDAEGNETTMDFYKLMKIVETSGFDGYVGIEWGGGYTKMSAEEGIKATKELLIKIRDDK